MKKKKLLYSSGAVLLLLLVSFFIYSQINAQNDQQVTHAEFVDILMEIMGLKNLLPEDADMSAKMALLGNRGYMPPGGWSANEILTKEDVAVVFVRILGWVVPPGSDAIQMFVDRDLMTPGNATLPFLEPDLIAFINALSGISGGRISPYEEPISPTT